MADKAKGTYSFSKSSRRLYYENINGVKTDIINKVLKALTSDVRIGTISFDYCDYSDLYLPDYFDKEGTFYFFAEVNYTQNAISYNNRNILFRFNPDKGIYEYYIFKQDTKSQDYCVSDDGKYVFVSLLEDYDRASGQGFLKIDLLSTDFKREPKEIYRNNNPVPHFNSIFNLHYDPNTKSLLFTADGWSGFNPIQYGAGLYILKPYKNNAYYAANLERHVYLSTYAFNSILEKSIRGGKHNSYFISNALKEWCGTNHGTDDIVINLSYFKDVENILPNGGIYYSLYKTDENGKVLTNTEAISHILDNIDLFLAFSKSYNKFYNRKEDSIPLDVLCYFKNTKVPAYNYTNFCDSEAANTYGPIFSNDDGVWGILSPINGNAFPQIFHIMDKNGNFLGKKEKGFEKIYLQEFRTSPYPIVVSKNGFTFIERNKKKIYHYENNVLNDLSYLNSKNENLTYDDIVKIYNKSKELSKNDNKTEKSQVVETKTTETEKTQPKEIIQAEALNLDDLDPLLDLEELEPKKKIEEVSKSETDSKKTEDKKTEPQTEIHPEAQPENKIETQPESKIETQTKNQTEVPAEIKKHANQKNDAEENVLEKTDKLEQEEIFSENNETEILTDNITQENTTSVLEENMVLQNIDSIPETQEIAESNVEKEEIETEKQLSVETQKLKQRVFILLNIVIVLVIAVFVLLLILMINYTVEKKKKNQFRNNNRFIFDIQEKERGKISRDIHDSVIQDIRAIRIDTELLNINEDSVKRKEKIINLATECVVKLRNICYNLTPAELMTHEAGDSSKIELISIIQNLVLQFIERTHIPCQLQIDENFEYPVFSKDVSQNLFRIVQEALNNVEKHSYATYCRILIKNKVEDDKKYTVFYISDDGIGCDINQILKKNKNHFGLKNMKGRAELIGAKMEFSSEQGQGMNVRIQI